MDTRFERERRLSHRRHEVDIGISPSDDLQRCQGPVGDGHGPKWPEARSTRVFWASTWTICSVWVRARNSSCASTSRSSTTIGDRKIALLVSIACAQVGSLSTDQRAPADPRPPFTRGSLLRNRYYSEIIGDRGPWGKRGDECTAATHSRQAPFRPICTPCSRTYEHQCTSRNQNTVNSTAAKTP